MKNLMDGIPHFKIHGAVHFAFWITMAIAYGFAGACIGISMSLAWNWRLDKYCEARLEEMWADSEQRAHEEVLARNEEI